MQRTVIIYLVHSGTMQSLSNDFLKASGCRHNMVHIIATVAYKYLWKCPAELRKL